MKEIILFRKGDLIPDSASFLFSENKIVVANGNVTDEFKAFYYEVKIHKEIKKSTIDVEGIVIDVIAQLNESTGKNFKPVGKNAQLIRDRIKTDKATKEDFMRCIENMIAEWDDNPDMKQYLRPATLFSASKFDGYVNHRTTGQDAADAFSDLESYMND